MGGSTIDKDRVMSDLYEGLDRGSGCFRLECTKFDFSFDDVVGAIDDRTTN